MENSAICRICSTELNELALICKPCGVEVELDPSEVWKRRFLRSPALGAAFATQIWAFGARMYVLFFLSLIPVLGLIPLAMLLMYGRRWSWRYGKWNSWTEFVRRMRTLDAIAGIWIATILFVSIAFIFTRY